MCVLSVRAETLLIVPFEDSTGHQEFSAWVQNFPGSCDGLFGWCRCGSSGGARETGLSDAGGGAALGKHHGAKSSAVRKWLPLLQAKYLLRGSFTAEAGKPARSSVPLAKHR